MIIIAGITFSVAVLVTIVALLVRRQLREKYAFLWLTIGLVLFILSIFPALLITLTHVLGVKLPSNLIFALAIVLLVGVCLHLSWELSRAEDEIRRLAEESAILRADVDALLANSGEHTVDGRSVTAKDQASDGDPGEPGTPRVANTQ